MKIETKNSNFKFPLYFDDEIVKQQYKVQQIKNFKPKVHFQDNVEAMIISIELANFKEEDLKINLKENLLTVSIKMFDNKKTMGKPVPNVVNRTFKVSEKEIDVYNISAKYLDGVLSIVLPKRQDREMLNLNIPINE